MLKMRLRPNETIDQALERFREIIERKNSQLMIAILEDNLDRCKAMRSVVKEKFPNFGIKYFRAIKPMLAWLNENLKSTVLISLDHDLELIPRDGQLVDPGTGVDVANWLANRQPNCPIIVHTSNPTAGDSMLEILTKAGLMVARVFPANGDEWIGVAWRTTLRDLIVTHAPIGSVDDSEGQQANHTSPTPTRVRWMSFELG